MEHEPDTSPVKNGSEPPEISKDLIDESDYFSGEEEI